jgi:putative alpha-1,2-mannosidase
MRASAVMVLALVATACTGSPSSPMDAGNDLSIGDVGTDTVDLDVNAEPMDVTVDTSRTDVPMDHPPPPPSRPASRPLRQWVDPMIATGGEGFSTGSAFPGPQRPFGMVRPGPDTTFPEGAAGYAHCAGYSYYDNMINGFSHTRMHGTGIVDYGAVALMPTVGFSTAKTHQNGYRSFFSHEREQAAVGYYAVTLDDTDVRVELTATDHVAFHRYSFPAQSDAVVLVDIGHALPMVTIVDGQVDVDVQAREISGFSHFSGGYSGRFGGMPVYFVARFDRAFSRHGVWSEGTAVEGETSRTGGQTGAYVAFDTTTQNTVEVRVGISFVDVAHARMNLDAESNGVTFEAVRADTEAVWERYLEVAEIEGRSEREFRTFYTAL